MMVSDSARAMSLGLKSERERMVEIQLGGRGIADLRILDAFRAVPRHEFVPDRYRDQAYRDTPLPIGEGQTISQPYMVAAMTSAARVSPGHRVLEIGTGSGYQAAILSELGAEVFSVERLPRLAEAARLNLERLGYRVAIHVGDGTLGWAEHSPYDRILVTAGAPRLPEPLPNQLAEGGRLIIPLENGYCQVLCVFEKSEGALNEERRERCTFVPLIGRFGWER